MKFGSTVAHYAGHQSVPEATQNLSGDQYDQSHNDLWGTVVRRDRVRSARTSPVHFPGLIAITCERGSCVLH